MVISISVHQVVVNDELELGSHSREGSVTQLNRLRCPGRGLVAKCRLGKLRIDGNTQAVATITTDIPKPQADTALDEPVDSLLDLRARNSYYRRDRSVLLVSRDNTEPYKLTYLVMALCVCQGFYLESSLNDLRSSDEHRHDPAPPQLALTGVLALRLGNTPFSRQAIVSSHRVVVLQHVISDMTR
jgi:hypothetical protein